MTTTAPRAHLGVVLSASNRWVEPYFRAFAPDALGIHVTRMRMADRTAGLARVRADALAAAALVADAGVDALDLQATGLIMAAGPAAEAELMAAIAETAGCPAYSATQALTLAARALDMTRVVLITVAGEAAAEEERAYLEAVGIEVAHAAGLALGGAAKSASLPPQAWADAAHVHDRADARGFVLSGSNTTMFEAVPLIEDVLAKPAVTSVQAALWAALRRLGPKLAGAPVAAPGRLFAEA